MALFVRVFLSYIFIYIRNLFKRLLFSEDLFSDFANELINRLHIHLFILLLYYFDYTTIHFGSSSQFFFFKAKINTQKHTHTHTSYGETMKVCVNLHVNFACKIKRLD